MLQTNTRKNYKILSLHNQFTLKKTFAFGGCEVGSIRNRSDTHHCERARWDDTTRSRSQSIECHVHPLTH